MTSNPYYFVLAAPNPEVSLAFFSGLFGWEPIQGLVPHGWNVDNAAFPGAVIASEDEPRATVYYNLPNEADVQVAVDLVRSLGGNADNPMDSPTGVSAKGIDNQGTHFAVGWERPEFVASWTQPAPLPNGELGFVSFPADDANKAVAFYSAVFGWDFGQPDAAHEAGGHRHSSTPSPTVGIHPKTSLDVPTLYFRVQDVAASAALVQELGGTPGPITSAQSGDSCDCLCSQGTPFGLWNPAPGYG